MHSRLRLAVLTACALACAAAMSPVAHAQVQIDFSDNAFTPQTARTLVPGAFEWDRAPGATNPHNIKQRKGLFRSGPPGGPGEFDHYELDFVSAGSFPYFCQVHAGMTGRIRVNPSLESFTDDSFDIRWASSQRPTGDQFDVRFSVNGGNWRPWKTNTRRLIGTFGQNDRPVDVEPGRVYRIQARSELRSNPDRRSDWSHSRRVQIP